MLFPTKKAADHGKVASQHALTQTVPAKKVGRSGKASNSLESRQRALAVKVEKRFGQEAKEALKSRGFLVAELEPLREGDYLFFPVKATQSALRALKLPAHELAKKSFKLRSFKSRSLRDALHGKLSPAEQKQLIASFDTVGQIAVIEIPDALLAKKKLIADALLATNSAIESVYRIASEHKGKYRVQQLKWVAGKKVKRAHYKEHGCTFVIDVDRVFFSPRLSQERKRIASLIKPGETVGCFFAGVGPYPIVFARNSRMAKAFAIELNPVAVKNLSENVKKNRVEDKIEIIQGDVNKVVPEELIGTCDRVVMPLPRGGEDFLDAAVTALKEKGTVHFYQFTEKTDPFKPAIEKLRAAAKRAGKKIRIAGKRKARAFSPSRVQVVVDAVFS